MPTSDTRIRFARGRHNLRGAPGLVIEVISPSNSRAKLRETISLCMSNGALECWLTDRARGSVTVVRKDGTTPVYEVGSEIPVTAFGSDALRVADLFTE